MKLAVAITGSSGATQKTRTSAVSDACSPIFRSAEYAPLEKLEGGELNDAKKILATEATAILHGRKSGRMITANTARETFEGGEFG